MKLLKEFLMKKVLLILLMFLLIPFVSIFTGCSSQEFTITQIESINGSYTLSHEKAKNGEDITITAVAQEGYIFDYALVNDKKITTNKFDMPNEDATVKVFFIPISGVLLCKFRMVLHFHLRTKMR